MSSSANNTGLGASGRTRSYSMLPGMSGRNAGSNRQQRQFLLTEAIAHERESESDAAPSSISDSPTEDGEGEDEPIPRSKPMKIPHSSALSEASTFINDNVDFRNWTTGYPPKKSFLRGDGNTPARFKMPRRSTLADNIELDDLLKASMINYDGHEYFPLTAATVRHLSPFWKGSKPVSDIAIFSCIMINKEVNAIHADHVVSALERIGEQCNHLVIMAPVRTSEMGNVFKREEDNINPDNDWDHLLRFFTALKHLVFIHPYDIPFDLSTDTISSLLSAVKRRQAALALQEVSIRVPPGVIAATAYNG